MTARRPLVIIDSQVQELPAGDTVAGVEGVTTWKEPVTVWNNGNPELVFTSDGDIVMAEVS